MRCNIRRFVLREVVTYFFKLGWLAFGGPVGQVGLMHLDCVERRGWISEEEFVRALNFCHVLPGPEATQLAIYIGWRKAGILGGILAGVLFIVPGFITLTGLAWIYVHYGHRREVLGVLWGFRPVGLALLCAAMLRIGRAALKSVVQVVLAAAALLAFHWLGVPFPLVLVACGLLYVGWRHALPAAAAALVLFPRTAAADPLARLRDISWFFLKTGLFSFGGAYAVLPYLRAGAVGHYHWITDPQMVDALALGETTPGPLISIGIFIGYLAGHGAGVGLLGAIAATFWLFLPSFLFVLPAAPHLERLASGRAKEFLAGITAGVVGVMVSVSIVLARVAVSPGGQFDPWTVVLAVVAFAALVFWKFRLNVVVVVVGGGLLGLLRVALG
jgi:chromate transporter